MIIPEGKIGEKSAEGTSSVGPTSDPPPAYVSSTSKPTAETTVSRPQPWNHVSVIRQNHSVKGSWTIDPSIYIPKSVLPPLNEGETEEDRKNLLLESHNGSVEAAIFLTDGSEQGQNETIKGSPRTTLSLHSHNSKVTAAIYTETETRRPFHITASSRNSSVTLYLPRPFRGFATLTSKNGSVVLSEELSKDATTFSDISGTRRCFIGDLANWVARDEEWQGDEVVADSHNSKVRLFYVDEAVTDSPKSSKNFWSRMFTGSNYTSVSNLTGIAFG